MEEHERDGDIYRRLGAVEADLAKYGAVLETVVGTLSDIKSDLNRARQPWPAVLSAGAASVGVVLLIVGQWTGTLREGLSANSTAIASITEVVREHQLDGHPRRVEQRVAMLTDLLEAEVTERKETQKYLLASIEDRYDEMDTILQREMRLLDEILQREMGLKDDAIAERIRGITDRLDNIESSRFTDDRGRRLERAVDEISAEQRRRTGRVYGGPE